MFVEVLPNPRAVCCSPGKFAALLARRFVRTLDGYHLVNQMYLLNHAVRIAIARMYACARLALTRALLRASQPPAARTWLGEKQKNLPCVAAYFQFSNQIFNIEYGAAASRGGCRFAAAGQATSNKK